ncbi:helix-turn-helix transcriptional regulator [Pantoea sp. M_5]|nr:helix-turn-helix transcriptional regulator [Pantoea sp. M_5]
MHDNPNKDRGRPRAFDTDAALDSAMLVFRQRGYHATSIGDLGQAMQLTTGSIYKAFTDKQTLFALFGQFLFSGREAITPPQSAIWARLCS